MRCDARCISIDVMVAWSSAVDSDSAFGGAAPRRPEPACPLAASQAGGSKAGSARASRSRRRTCNAAPLVNEGDLAGGHAPLRALEEHRERCRKRFAAQAWR
jgi:hypothetical protein